MPGINRLRLTVDGAPVPHSRGSTDVSVARGAHNDPVVPAWSCPIPGARNVEVSGTHTGLVYNGSVYRELAAVLT